MLDNDWWVKEDKVTIIDRILLTSGFFIWVGVMIAIFIITDAAVQLYNPEYWAFKDVLRQISRL